MIPTKLQNSFDKVAEVCRKYNITELSLFGSQVRGDAIPQSDFDFLVEFFPEAQIGFVTLGKIQTELSEIIQSPVDVVPKAGLKAAIRAQVLAEAEVLYAA
jgi:predicted nucleotidyltransferase